MHKKIVVIGAGAVGLATAYKLLKTRPDLHVTVLEKENDVAAHQTSHNSGVIHSGLYYQPGSEKAKLAVRGRNEMVEFCAANNVAHEVCGKLVVAVNNEEHARLKTLHERGLTNGLTGLRFLTPEQAREIEPHVNCVAALLVPETGITDFAEVSKAIARNFEQLGGSVVTGAKVTGIQSERGWTLSTSKGEFVGDYLVTCAGLQADRMARMAGAETDVRIVPFRGDYFTLKDNASQLVRHLIYPVPNPLFPFLGVHATRSIHGHRHVGPTVAVAFARERYSRWAVQGRDAFSAATFSGLWRFVLKHRDLVKDGIELALRKRAFVRAVGRLIPELCENDLDQRESGIRAQAMLPNGQLVVDYTFAQTTGALHVLNAPSPAATCSLAIGQAIADRVIAALADY